MKTTSALLLLATLVFGMPVSAAHAGQLKFTSADEPSVVQTNFNFGTPAPNDDYPPVRNAVKGPTLASEIPAHSKYICFGESCDCHGAKAKHDPKP